MQKWKKITILLLTVIFLVVFASLPEIAAVMQDAAAADEIGFSAMPTVTLDFSGERQPVSILSKLALIRDGNFYTISPRETIISQGEIENVVREGLNPYYEAELVSYNWKNCEFSAVPHLVSDPTDVKNYAILWIVSLYWPDSSEILELYVEDETGLILYFHFGTKNALDVYSAQGYLDAFSSVYLESTGMSEILAHPDDYGVESVTYSDAGMYTNDDKSFSCTLHHPDYSSITLDFWLYKNGYYTQIR